MALTRLAVAGFAVACCYVAGSEIVDRLQGSLILPEDPLESALALAEQGRWAEVKMIADFVAERPDLDHSEGAGQLARQAELELDSFWGQLERFTQGAVTGEPTDLISMLGSLSLDLFVVGDVRDLVVQGWKQASDGTGDNLILALSAIGLGTTLSPQLDWAPALLKTLKRSGALTEGFLKGLTRTSREALETGKYTRLSGVATDLGKAAKRLGPGPLRGVMRSVDSAEDLAKIAKAADIDAKGTYVVARMFGRDGVKRLSRDGRNIGILVTSIKTGSRLTKTVRKSTAALSTSWLSLILAAAILILVATVAPSRKRTRPRQDPVSSCAPATGQSPEGTLSR